MADIIQKTDSLNDGRVKLNKAITQAEQAGFDASKAIGISGSLRTELDTLVIEGDSSVEAAQARVDEEGKAHPTLKTRIDEGIKKAASLVGDTSAEVSQSRLDLKGTLHTTLKQRLDADHADVASYVELKIEDTNEKIDVINGLSTEVINIYVDSILGDDNTGDGANYSPFKTIQRAVNSIPKIINKDRFIYIKDGIYNEEVKVIGINGAAIVLGRIDGINSPADGGTGLLVKSISFYDCSGLCRVNNFEQINASQITLDAFVRFSRCGYGTAHALRCADSSITKNTIEFDGTIGSVNASFFNGQEKCVVSKNGSSVRVDSSNTHGSIKSNTGLTTDAGSMYINGDVAWVNSTNTPVERVRGGVVNYDVKVIELTPLLKNKWAAYDNVQNRPIAIKRRGVVELAGLIKDGNSGQGVIAFTLPAGWSPKYVNRFYSPFGSDGLTTKVLIDREGVCAIEKSTGQYISLSDIPPFYAGE